MSDETLFQRNSVHCMDCMDLLRGIASCSIDSVVTDPPYHLTTRKKGGTGFMGKAWDGGDITHRVEMWAEVLRVLKPGGHLLSFAATRTYHRMACAIEDAGFEIRDQIGWLYGSGFPKSLDVGKAIDAKLGGKRKVLSASKAVKRMIPGADQGKTGSWVKDNGREFVPTVTAAATEEAKQWDGWGTALKPAWEPICLARKPLLGTVAENILSGGLGALNVDGCRIPLKGDYKSAANGRPSQTGLGDNYDPDQANQQSDQGRWPANVIHDGSEEVLACFPVTKSGANPTRRLSDKFQNSYGEFKGQSECVAARGADEGSAARFFYVAKASGDEREGNDHPTVKPLALMRYLVKLVTPPGGVVLDQFAGSGTTLVAAKNEGFSFIGCDNIEEHVRIIEARLAKELL